MDQQIIDFIKKSLEQGVPEDAIRQQLTAAGWKPEMVEEAFNVGKPPAIAVPQPSAPKPKSPALFSPYSILLSLVLTGALFSLAWTLLRDLHNLIGNGYADRLSRLLVDTAVIVPFWFITFILDFSLGIGKKKYIVLSRPFYLVSGWLLIKLLFELGGFIIDKNTSAGIYIVLVVVIGVMTGVILGIQKYQKYAE